MDDVCALPGHPATPLALAVPLRDVLVVAGLPGAGKTTLLRAVAGDRDVVLDPQLLAERVQAALPAVPYALYRPVVHTLHRVLVLRALLTGVDGLIVHEPGARPRWRRLLVSVARRRGRRVQLLVVRAEPDEAAAGRVKRARTLSARRAERHVREWTGLCAELEHGWAGSRLAAEGFVGCTLLPRSAVPSVVSVRGVSS